jgi:hypothetical protein
MMAVISAVLILVGRIGRDMWWGDWAFVAGIGLLVVAGVLFLITRR